jgi:hypothetical protein
VVLIVVLAVLWIVTGMEGILLEVAAASTLLAMQVQLACWSLLHSRDRDEDE